MQHSILNYSHHTVHYRTYLFLLLEVCNFWPPSSISPTLPSASGYHQPVFCICEYRLFGCCYFLDTTHQWDHKSLSFSVWLTSFNIMPSRSIHVVSNSQISFFLAEWFSYVYIIYLHTAFLLEKLRMFIFPFVTIWKNKSINMHSRGY